MNTIFKSYTLYILNLNTNTYKSIVVYDKSIKHIRDDFEIKNNEKLLAIYPTNML
jgi:hypothetical protein